MRSLGGLLLFFGVGSAILHFLGMEFIILMWIDMWGQGVGWIIRGVMIVVGGLMWLVGMAQEGGAAAGDEPTPDA